MELKIKKLTKFKTPDQKEFDIEEDAIAYMKNSFVRDQLLTAMSCDKPLRDSITMNMGTIELQNRMTNNIIDFIVNNKTTILNLFNQTDKIEVE